jgi:uncharacterized protein with HEPN domain
MKKDKPTSKERAEHILEAIENIKRFTYPHSQLSTFLADDRTISACLYQYTIIGEALVNIDTEILEKYKYPWHKVKSFRNFILHDYDGIEMRLVWDTTMDILPGLKDIMEKILRNEF